VTKKFLVPINVNGDVVATYGNFTFGAYMGGAVIDAVADPTSPQQAATKAYVDAHAGSNEVFVGPADPGVGAGYDLWVDSDEPSPTPGGTAVPTPGRNIAHNGQLLVKQRSISSVVPASASYLCDRWAMFNQGLGSVTTARYDWPTFQSVKGGTWPSGRPRPGFVQYSQAFTPEAAGSLSAGDRMYMSQAYEGQDVQHLNWGYADAQPVTFSFDCFSTVAATFVVELYNYNAARSISKTVTASAGWSTLVASFPGDTNAAAAIPCDNQSRLGVSIVLGAGSSFTTGAPQTSWADAQGSNRWVGVSNTWAATANSVFAATNLQLEVGSTATPYEVRSYDAELERCMRYFTRIEATESYMPFASGQCYGATSAGTYLVLPVVMRTTPTVTFSAANLFMVHAAAGAVTACTAMSAAGNKSPRMIRIDSTVASGLVAGSATTLYSNNNITAEINCSADIS
jgi:hypothetical protein